MVEEKRTLKNVLKDLGESSSLHGIPKIISSRQTIVKLLWCILLLGAVGLSTFTMVGLFEEYNSYPVKTSVSLKYEKLPFPAITFCNSNPIRLSKLPEDEVMNNILLKKLKSGTNADPWDAIDSFFDETFDALDDANDTASDDYEYDYYEDNLDEPLVRDEFEAWRERVLVAYKELSGERRAYMGHQLSDMLHQFTFLGYQVNIEANNTPLIQSPLYGNCYVLNLKAISQTSGPSKGVRMILNVEKSEYVDHFVTGYGIRLSIHEPGTLAIPDKDSIILNPGFEANIGLKMLRIKRLGGKYGKCTNGQGFETSAGSAYSVAMCHAMCERESVRVFCNCIPFDSPNADGYEGRICHVDDVDEMACVRSVRDQIYLGNVNCDCQPRCDEDTYTMKITGRKWPNANYLQHVLMSRSCSKNITSMISACKLLNTTGSITASNYEDFASNFVAVNIFFEDLNFEIIQEEPLYNTIRFLSDLGGAMGFYMGASLLTYVEILQLLLELGLFCKSKMSRKTAPSSGKSGVSTKGM